MENISEQPLMKILISKVIPPLAIVKLDKEAGVEIVRMKQKIRKSTSKMQKKSNKVVSSQKKATLTEMRGAIPQPK